MFKVLCTFLFFFKAFGWLATFIGMSNTFGQEWHGKARWVESKLRKLKLSQTFASARPPLKLSVWIS